MPRYLQDTSWLCPFLWAGVLDVAVLRAYSILHRVREWLLIFGCPVEKIVVW